jgi:hypothetical protein
MRHPGRLQRFIAGVCGTLGALLILAALLLGYATRSLFNEGAFAARVASSLEDPRVANFVAEQLADAVIKAKPDLVGLRPVLIGVARTVVTTAPFRAAVRRSARLMHHAVLSGTGREIVLSVQDIGVLFESMAATQPGLAKKIPPRISAALGKLNSLPGGERAVKLARFANRLRAGAFGLLLLGLLFCTASAWLARSHRLAIVRIGLALAVVGVVLGILAHFGGDLIGVFARREQNSPALTGLGAAFLGGLQAWAIGLTLGGVVPPRRCSSASSSAAWSCASARSSPDRRRSCVSASRADCCSPPPADRCSCGRSPPSPSWRGSRASS